MDEFDEFEAAFADELDALHDLEQHTAQKDDVPEAKRARKEQPEPAHVSPVAIDFSSLENELIIDENRDPDTVPAKLLSKSSGIPRLEQQQTMDPFAESFPMEASSSILHRQTTVDPSQAARESSGRKRKKKAGIHRSMSMASTGDFYDASLPTSNFTRSPPESPGESSAMMDIERIMVARKEKQRNKFLESQSGFGLGWTNDATNDTQSTVYREAPKDRHSISISYPNSTRKVYLNMCIEPEDPANAVQVSERLFVSDMVFNINATNDTQSTVYHEAPKDRHSISISYPNSTRKVYLNMCIEPEDPANAVQETSFKDTHLLAKPFREILADVEALKQEKLLRIAQRTTDREGADAIPCTQQKGPSLWVEKYRPLRYIDLLSNDGINRTLLTWLKLWDECVFGEETKPKKALAMKKNPEQDGKKPGFKGGKGYDPDDLSLKKDDYKRPEHKMALLCGPPGLGKTTLAHVISQHARYNVIELNASDDRSVDCFRNCIESATQMKACIEKDARPNCIVIDEIDGAPTASVNYLVGLAKETHKGKKNTILKRPVICICNDLYATSLRELRKIALVLHFPQTDIHRLADRLMRICSNENMPIEKSVLTALSEKSINDIRSCINTLQLFHKQKRKVTLDDVKYGDVGLKDTQKDLFAVWTEIFYLATGQKKPKAAMKRRLLTQDSVDCSDVNSAHGGFHDADNELKIRFDNVYHSVLQCVDRSRLMDGIFENYLSVKLKDSKMHNQCFAGDWLVFYDIIDHKIMSRQLWELFPYLNYVPVFFHLLFASSTFTKLQYPSTPFEVRTKQAQCDSVVQSVLVDVTPGLRSFVRKNVLTLEVLPSLVNIVSPPLRQVSVQLYSAKERAELTRIVDIMINYNLTYRQQRTPEGQYEFVFEPAIDHMLQFDGIKTRNQLSYATKQMLAHEIELEKVRRAEPGAKHNPPESTKDNSSRHEKGARRNPFGKMNAGPSVKSKPSEALRHMPPQPIQADVAKRLEKKPATDFFGRPISTSTNASNRSNVQGANSASSTTDGSLFFKFKAGHVNAIRKNIRMQDLI